MQPSLNPKNGSFIVACALALGAVLAAPGLPAGAAPGREASASGAPGPRSSSQEAKSAREFIPQGWKLEKSIKGDLNKDGAPDEVVVAGQYSGEDAVDVGRMLIVAFSAPGTANGLRKVVSTEKLTLLSGDAGMLGEREGGHVDARIERGNLVVENMWGSRVREVLTLRFRWNEKLKIFELIGADYESFDRAGGDVSRRSTNLITGDRITETRRINDQGNEKVIGSKRTKMPTKPLKRLEQVDVLKLIEAGCAI